MTQQGTFQFEAQRHAVSLHLHICPHLAFLFSTSPTFLDFSLPSRVLNQKSLLYLCSAKFSPSSCPSSLHHTLQLSLGLERIHTLASASWPYGALSGPPEPNDQVDMSALKSSSTGTVAHAQQTEVGGTSFLDLPLELREMIYDLCVPKKRDIQYFNLPFEPQSKPVVVGVSLLRCSKQIHNEISQRVRLWDGWRVSFGYSPKHAEHSTVFDCSLAMSCLHDLALAKPSNLYLSFRMNTKTEPMLRVCGFEVLLKLKSLRNLSIFVYLTTSPKDPPIRGASDLEDLPLVTGLVIRVLSHIPTSVGRVGWHIFHGSIQTNKYCPFLEQLASKFESHRGSAYTSHPSTRATRDIGKSLHF